MQALCNNVMSHKVKRFTCERHQSSMKKTEGRRVWPYVCRLPKTLPVKVRWSRVTATVICDTFFLIRDCKLNP